MDSGLFWKNVNSRRSTLCTNSGSGIKLGDNVCRDFESFVSGWEYTLRIYIQIWSAPLRPAF